MATKDDIVLITGSNRGIGRALAEAYVQRGVKRLYVAARRRGDLDSVVALDRARVVPIELDVTKPEQVRAAAGGRWCCFRADSGWSRGWPGRPPMRSTR